MQGILFGCVPMLSVPNVHGKCLGLTSGADGSFYANVRLNCALQMAATKGVPNIDKHRAEVYISAANGFICYQLEKDLHQGGKKSTLSEFGCWSDLFVLV